MQLKYRNHEHADDEVGVTMKQETLWSERGRAHATRHTWTIQGQLIGNATQAEITTAIQALEDAYSVDGGDLTLYLSDGTTVSAHRLRSRDTIGGVKIVQRPSFPKGDGAEYAAGCMRTYEIVAQADFPIWSENLLAWHQAFSIRGIAGAEKWVLVPTLNGSWQRQTVNARTPMFVIQKGFAVGQFRYPIPAAPLFSAVFEHGEQRLIDKDDPQRIGTDLTNYRINWQYTFESNTPIIAGSAVP